MNTCPVRHEDREIYSFDHTKIYFQTWTPAEIPVKANLLIVHGYAEHSSRYRKLAHHFAASGFRTIGFDYRGHGHAGGQRGYCDNFFDFHNDLESAIQQLDNALPLFALGHSHGGLVVLDYLQNQESPFKGVVLTNPYLGLSIPQPKAKLAAGRLAAFYAPRLSIPSGLPTSGLSHDPCVIARYERDPLIFPTATAGWFHEAEAAQSRVKETPKCPVPLLYFYSDSDPIASVEANRYVAHKIETPDKTVIVRRGELHEILNETKRQECFDIITNWIQMHLN
ncbi:MAG: lysophospholipase [Myxococcota bacterium]|nr:lysophospholipase [Myxococcota bacterium]